MSLLREMWNNEVLYMMSDLHKLRQRSRKQNNQLERLKRLDVSMRESALKNIMEDAMILNRRKQLRKETHQANPAIFRRACEEEEA